MLLLDFIKSKIFMKGEGTSKVTTHYALLYIKERCEIN